MYDFIIVGGGSAGCVLAARLSEDPGARVLLLEAGPEDDVREVRVPLAFSRLFKTDLDWNYETEPQARMDGRRLFWPRGKVLGGSSSINAMIYVRGHRDDYDAWAEGGCEGWSFAEVLPYFRRSECYEHGASAFRGGSGPMSVVDLPSPHPLTEAFVEACEAVGIPRNPDPNAGRQEGATVNQVTQRGGRRHSTARAFLTPDVRRRPNLTIRTGAQALRVLIEQGRARGVEYLYDGQTEAAGCDGEVVLAAGAIGSPRLLQLSGVGSADVLRRLGLSVAADVPGVGENLHDHLICGVAYRCHRTRTLAQAETLANALRYLALGYGPLTSNVAEGTAFIHTREGLAAPDIQFHFAPVLFENHGLEPPAFEAFGVGPTLLTPQSRGRLRLRSADPLDKPLLEPEYLSDSDDHDVMTLVRGLQRGREVLLSAPFDRYRLDEYLPGERAETDAELAAFVRARAETLYHPVGTCAMGTGEDAVVDPALRVRGVEGLRVADASIMPTIPRGNTNAPVIMIAEKASDLLLGRMPPTRRVAKRPTQRAVVQ